MSKKVAVLFQRYGPYHWARLKGATKYIDAVGVEMYRHDNTYAWENTLLEDVPSVTVFPESTADDVSVSNIWNSVSAALGTLSPDVVAVHGWSLPSALAALDWCLSSGTPSVVMSESTPHDFERVRWKEIIKQFLVKGFQAGLVGGGPHINYLCDLGMPSGQIFAGYDVVDNQHFIRGSDAARQDEDTKRSALSLPENYFLASNRFIPKKNLKRLLTAYRAYRDARGEDAWHLVLLGDGLLWDEVVSFRDTIGLQEYVHLPGFQQYDILPSYYGLARAFVHASTTEQWGLVVNEALASGLPVLVSERCGCAPNLVVEEQNGYVFDPYDTNAIAEKLLKLDSRSSDVAKMGTAGRKHVRKWGPDRFGQGLAKAVEAALSAPLPSYVGLRRFLVQVMMRT